MPRQPNGEPWPWQKNRKKPPTKAAKIDERYEPIAVVPDGLTWKPAPPYTAKNFTVLLSLGGIYKLVRTRETGAVVYYKLKDDTKATPAAQIDAEPQRKQQQRFHTGSQCWFVDTGSRWYLVEVVRRSDKPPAISIKSVTGWDADRTAPWGYGEELEFPASQANPLFQRLRKLKDRYQ